MSAMEDTFPTSSHLHTSITSSLQHQTSTPLPNILCCMCGIQIEANPANMCINCLKSKVDITEGITKQCTLFWCRNCGRYQRPPWVDVQLESREMLAMCLKKIKGLNKDVKLVDAGFIWTEPHSKRIKVKLTIQKEVFNSAILQQIFVVEFVIQNQQCTDCQKSYTEHTWTALVQLRQKVKHKKTMFYLEQLLLKHSVVERAIQVKSQPDGLDIYWGGRSGAMKMLDFLRGVVPIRSTASKKLVSQDLNSNIANYKYTLNAEIAPICKDDLVLLEPRLQHQLGGVSPILLVIRVTATITMIDPVTLKVVEVSGGTYFHHPFRALLSGKQMIEYTVLDIEKVDLSGKDKNSSIQDHRSFNKQTLVYNAKLAQAHVTLVRTSDFGQNDVQFECMTHLGNLLQPGDTCMGYDLTNANWNDQVQLNKGKELPDVILVRKSYPTRKNRAKKRNFELKSLPKEQSDKVMKKSDIAREEEEMEDFIRDVEEDPELQSKINLYKRKGAVPDEKDDDDMNEDDDGFPQISMDQLLDDMGNVRIGVHDGNESESDIDDEAFLRATTSDGTVSSTSSFATSTGPNQLSKPK